VNQGKMKKTFLTPLRTPQKNLKGKKSRDLACILGLPIGCMKFLFPKEFITIFGLGQVPLATNTLPSRVE
jgi:hypothetical protein